MLCSYEHGSLHKLQEMLLSANHRKEILTSHTYNGFSTVFTSFFQMLIKRLLNFLANTFSKLFVSLLSDFYSAFRNP